MSLLQKVTTVSFPRNWESITSLKITDYKIESTPNRSQLRKRETQLRTIALLFIFSEWTQDWLFHSVLLAISQNTCLQAGKNLALGFEPKSLREIQGLIPAPGDQSTGAQWGCNGIASGSGSRLQGKCFRRWVGIKVTQTTPSIRGSCINSQVFAEAGFSANSAYKFTLS